MTDTQRAQWLADRAGLKFDSGRDAWIVACQEIFRAVRFEGKQEARNESEQATATIRDALEKMRATHTS